MKTLFASLVAALMLAPSAFGADVLSLDIASPPGDPFGQGVAVSAATPADPLRIFFWSSGAEAEPPRGQGVGLTLDGAAGASNVQIGVPQGQFLAVGTYANAVSPTLPLDPSRPSLGVTLDGRGCSDGTGSFTVTRADYTPNGNLYALDASFALTSCNGEPTAVSGSISLVYDTIETVIDRKVRLRNGFVTVTGKTFCSLPHTVSTDVGVNQPVVLIEASAVASTTPTPCVPNGVVPWSVTMQSLEGRVFRGGEARVSTYATTELGLFEVMDLREFIVRLVGR